MKPEIKALWLAALRSEEYPKGTDCLRDAFGHYCCLGVLCDVSSLSAWRDNEEDADTKMYLSHTLYLPDKVREWAGISPDHIFTDGVSQHEQSLARLNDKSSNFDTVIEYIENNL